MKIGLVIMFRLDSGGGAPRLIVDLIKDLNFLGHKVFLLTPFKLNYQKIEKLYEPIKIEKLYNVSKLKSFFCQNSILGRKIIRKEFQEMVEEVDKIIDIDGGIVHDYLPENFDKSKYIVWRFAVVESDSVKNFEKKGGLKRNVKDFIKKILHLEQNEKRNSLSKEYKVYPIDEWARKRLIEKWGLSPEKVLIHTIHTEEYKYNGEKKKNQGVVLARLAQNKMIDDSVRIFFLGTKNRYRDYKLIILGGTTSDSEFYLKYLDKLIKELGIQKRVKIIKNPSSKTCRQFLIESKVIIDSQNDISLTMGSVEAMAAGCIVLVRKNTGTYQETLMNGKFGFGFDNIEDGGKKLEMILKKLEEGSINNKGSIKRSDFLSEKNFIKRLKEVLSE